MSAYYLQSQDGHRPPHPAGSPPAPSPARQAILPNIVPSASRAPLTACQRVSNKSTIPKFAISSFAPLHSMVEKLEIIYTLGNSFLVLSKESGPTPIAFTSLDKSHRLTRDGLKFTPAVTVWICDNANCGGILNPYNAFRLQSQSVKCDARMVEIGDSKLIASTQLIHVMQLYLEKS